jgi:preprotein translocase subunit SecF
LIQIKTPAPIGTGVIRTALTTGGVPGAEVQTFGSETEFSIRARLSAEENGQTLGTQETRAAVQRALDAGLGAGRYEIVRAEAVGPKVGRELQGKALVAVLFSFVVTLIYLAFRFEWRFGLAAVIATAHDILATMAFIRYLNLEVSLVVIAAILTIVGYSLNDTIVIFDRVRENLRQRRKEPLPRIINDSINQTLTRSIISNGTTFLAVLGLYLFGGEVLKGFAFTMVVGIVVGTYSTIYIASPIVVFWQRLAQRKTGATAKAAL